MTVLNEKKESEEIWAEIPGSGYKASSKGKVIRPNGKAAYTWVNNSGNLVCDVRMRGKKAVTMSVARCMALAFGILKPGDGLVVAHINRDRMDNRLENLTAMTFRQLIKRRGTLKVLWVPVSVFDKRTGAYLCTYESQLECCRDLGLKASNVCNALKGKIHGCKGYDFKYAKKVKE